MLRAFATALVFLLAGSAAASADDIADLRRGAMAEVSGTVERVLDYDEFRLKDATGNVRVYVGPQGHTLQEGQKVAVKGRVDDDLGPLEIYATEIRVEGGETYSFSHRYD